MPVNYNSRRLQRQSTKKKKNSVATYIPKEYGDNVTFNDVKNDPEFQKYLYYSGGRNAPVGRKVANLINVGGNYINGLIDPDGPTRFDLGEGTERQAVAASLYNMYYGDGTPNISDVAHSYFEPQHGDSGKSFHGQNVGSLGWNKVKDQTKNAINSPYHNIYGQSSGVYFDKDGYHAPYDNYSFNNVWGHNGKKPVVTQVLKDGEGNASLVGALKEGFNALTSGVTGVQPLMETVASKRGVNTKRHKDVQFIPTSTLDAWAKEWVQSKKKK